MKFGRLVMSLLGGAKKGAPDKPISRTEVGRSDAGSETGGMFEYAGTLLDNGPDGYFIEPSGTFELEIVGESYYQSSLSDLAGRKTETGVDFPCKAKLVCDRNNKHDRLAVSVRIDGRLVGHLSKPAARAWRKMLAAAGARGSEVVVDARIVGGWKREVDGLVEEGFFSVKLDVPVDGEELE